MRRLEARRLEVRRLEARRLEARRLEATCRSFLTMFILKSVLYLHSANQDLLEMASCVERIQTMMAFQTGNWLVQIHSAQRYEDKVPSVSFVCSTKMG